jgi:hypothetical protein
VSFGRLPEGSTNNVALSETEEADAAAGRVADGALVYNYHLALLLPLLLLLLLLLLALELLAIGVALVVDGLVQLELVALGAAVLFASAVDSPASCVLSFTTMRLMSSLVPTTSPLTAARSVRMTASRGSNSKIQIG